MPQDWGAVQRYFAITSILAELDISIEAILQKEPKGKEDAMVAIITSVVTEERFAQALERVVESALVAKRSEGRASLRRSDGEAHVPRRLLDGGIVGPEPQQRHFSGGSRRGSRRSRVSRAIVVRAPVDLTSR